MKANVLLGCLVLAVALSACRKKSDALPTAPPAPAPAPGAAPEGTPANPGNAAEMAFSNASVLTMLLQEYESVNKRLPSSVKELESIKTYGPVPPPPVGYRYVIDAKKKQVIAVKQ